MLAIGPVIDIIFLCPKMTWFLHSFTFIIVPKNPKVTHLTPSGGTCSSLGPCSSSFQLMPGTFQVLWP